MAERTPHVWMAVLVSTVLTAAIGFLWPGSVAGLGFPLSLTAWWLLCRFILWREKRDPRG